MKTHLTIAAAVFALAATATDSPAQAAPESELSDQVLEAIREFNRRNETGESNEVLVVLDTPEATEPAEEWPAAARDQPASEPANGIAEDAIDAEGIPPTLPPTGPVVRVQSLREAGEAAVDASDIRITTPFPAKPLGAPPPGWRIVVSDDAPEFSEKVEVSPGTWITLGIRPHVLVPAADGREVFHIREPGFAAAEGYRQTTTVSAAIAASLHQLEDDARVLGQVVDQLEQILISLPNPANIQQPTPDGENIEQ
jgi:hypothetical protein